MGCFEGRLADIRDDNKRERGTALFVERAREETREIRSWMTEARWKTGLATVGGIIAALPGVSAVYGLLNAVREAIVGGAPPPPPRDFAYAAHLQARLT